VWLSPYHDMGLIGGILSVVLAGVPLVLFSPLAFLRRPALWLQAMSQRRATHTGCPNFALDFCARTVTAAEKEGLDLSALRVVVMGGETNRAASIGRFLRAFGQQGVREAAFKPGYALAENTLTVAITRSGASRATTLRLDRAQGNMVINEPYNPAGTLMSKERQAALVALARRHGITILSDEVYRLLEHDASDRLPAMADLYERGISAVTMSKPWGACGVTIGWLAFADAAAVRQRLVDVQYFGTACPSRASELQAMMVLRSSDAILARNLALIRRNVAALAAFIGA
jgi:aspartate/methionine/tyrosine aminotransferase